MKTLLPLLFALAATPGFGRQAAASAPQEVVLRGRAVCLDADGDVSATGADCPDEPAGGWALRTGDEALQRLSPLDERVAILSDARVRSHELQITAWRNDDGELSIVHLRTVIDGRLHDPHYYCALCSIRSNTPGLCWCCQQPFEFRDPPLEEDEEPQP